MTTKICTLHSFWRIQITIIPRAKSHIQNCLSDGFRERVGINPLGFEVLKNPVFMRVCGLHQNCHSVFATLLQHAD